MLVVPNWLLRYRYLPPYCHYGLLNLGVPLGRESIHLFNAKVMKMLLTWRKKILLLANPQLYWRAQYTRIWIAEEVNILFLFLNSNVLDHVMVCMTGIFELFDSVSIFFLHVVFWQRLSIFVLILRQIYIIFNGKILIGHWNNHEMLGMTCPLLYNSILK